MYIGTDIFPEPRPTAFTWIIDNVAGLVICDRFAPSLVITYLYVDGEYDARTTI